MLIRILAFSLLIYAGTSLAQTTEYASGHGALELWDYQAMQNLPFMDHL